MPSLHDEHSSCRHNQACTTILVGSGATTDGSVMLATSCDGNVMGRVYVQPETDYPGTATVDMFYDAPAPATWTEYQACCRRGDTRVGELRLDHTCRCILAAGHLADSVTGGLNEHGLCLGIEYMGMRPELANPHGIVSSCSSHWTSSLIANALLRTRTAREAVRLMGAMAEQHGFTYYWAPNAGCAIPVADRTEAWIMEIFGPGPDWTPGCGKPGAVWCAQRVADGEVTCNTNRSRIGPVDPEDADRFMTSPNLYALAEALGLWQPGTPFVWHDVYGVTGTRANSLREWAILNALAPSLKLVATGDPDRDRYPFSVPPDAPVSVPKLTAIMRDHYAGTPFDVTAHPRFNRGGTRSPLARPYGTRDLFDLLGIAPERCVATETSGYVYIAQLRDYLPAPLAGCLWFTLGPALTSCFAPIYSGVTEIPGSWSRRPNFTAIDPTQMQWQCQLVAALAELRHQDAISEIRSVLEPAEAGFLERQPQVEDTVAEIFRGQGKVPAQDAVTAYSSTCLENSARAYAALADHLMFKYLYRYPDVAPRLPQQVTLPPVPGR